MVRIFKWRRVVASNQSMGCLLYSDNYFSEILIEKPKIRYSDKNEIIVIFKHNIEPFWIREKLVRIA